MEALIYKRTENDTWEFVMSDYEISKYPLSKGMYLCLKNYTSGSIDYYYIEHIVLESIYASPKYEIYCRIEKQPSFLTNGEQQITK